MKFYSPVTVTLNLLNVVFSVLMICSLKCPESVFVMFVMVRDAVVLPNLSLPLNLSLTVVVPESFLTTRMFSAPSVHSIRSLLCILVLVGRETEPPAVADSFFTSCHNSTQKQRNSVLVTELILPSFSFIKQLKTRRIEVVVKVFYKMKIIF